MPPLNPPKRLQNVVEVIDLDPPPRKNDNATPSRKNDGKFLRPERKPMIVTVRRL